MDTQAANLRARVAAAAASVAPAPQQRAAVAGVSAQTPVRLARTIAVASGKGGVGKSTLALGIAMAAAERGVKTALVDADLGLANLDVLCGVRPARTAADWLSGRAQLSECFTTIAPRLWLLAGASGVARMADLERPQRARLIEGLARVAAHVELMVVDLGAGIGAGTLDIAAAADRLLIVTTPEPTSLADAYGFAKACVRHGRRDGWCCATTMAIDAADGSAAAARLTRTAQAHLGITFMDMGSVPVDRAVPLAVRSRTPLLTAAPESSAARAMRGIESRLAGLDDGVQNGEESGRFFANFAARMGVRWGNTAAMIAAGVAGIGGVSAR
jgi:flagellar biosynthesis protein FlhG